MTTTRELHELIDELERNHTWHAHEMHRIDLELALLRRELEDAERAARPRAKGARGR